MGRGKWQPIETAPRDGTRVLVVGYGLRGRNIFAAKFDVSRTHGQHPDAWSWVVAEVERGADSSICITIFGVSHWMPLPKLPAERK